MGFATGYSRHMTTVTAPSQRRVSGARAGEHGQSDFVQKGRRQHADAKQMQSMQRPRGGKAVDALKGAV